MGLPSSRRPLSPLKPLPLSLPLEGVIGEGFSEAGTWSWQREGAAGARPEENTTPRETAKNPGSRQGEARKRPQIPGTGEGPPGFAVSSETDACGPLNPTGGPRAGAPGPRPGERSQTTRALWLRGAAQHFEERAGGCPHCQVLSAAGTTARPSEGPCLPAWARAVQEPLRAEALIGHADTRA